MSAFKLNSIFGAFKDPYKVINMLAVLTLVLFASGAFAQSGSVYGQTYVQSSSPVTRGTVIQVREVKQEASQNARYAGMTAGGALGAVATTMGNNSSGVQTALGVLGAVLGGVGGQYVANAVAGSVAYEYIVQTEASAYRPAEVIAIVQPDPGPQINSGEQVFLIQTNGTWRVIRNASGLSASR